MNNGLNNVKQGSVNLWKDFQRKNYRLKKTGCQRVIHNTGLPETLINKKMICSTKHIIEMTINETKTLKETIIQQRYNRHPRQANSNYQNNDSAETGDALVEILISIICQASSTETLIVPET